MEELPHLSDHLILRDKICLGELPLKGLLKVEVTAPDGGAGPDREDSVPESGLKVREDTVRVRECLIPPAGWCREVHKHREFSSRPPAVRAQ